MHVSGKLRTLGLSLFSDIFCIPFSGATWDALKYENSKTDIVDVQVRNFKKRKRFLINEMILPE